MSSDDSVETKLELVNFRLSDKLSKQLRDLKDWKEISQNTDMIRHLITEGHKSMIKEKRDLGLIQQDIFE